MIMIRVGTDNSSCFHALPNFIYLLNERNLKKDLLRITRNLRKVKKIYYSIFIIGVNECSEISMTRVMTRNRLLIDLTRVSADNSEVV